MTKNFFLIPRGNTAKNFIMECARIINLYNNNTIMKPIALKSLMVFLPLMLQKPSMKSKAKDHSRGNRTFLRCNFVTATFGAATFVAGHFVAGLFRCQTISAPASPDFPQNFLHFSCT